MTDKIQYIIKSLSLNNVTNRAKDELNEKGEEITDELVQEFATLGRILPDEFIALCRSANARYVRSRDSIVFLEE